MGCRDPEKAHSSKSALRWVSYHRFLPTHPAPLHLLEHRELKRKDPGNWNLIIYGNLINNQGLLGLIKNRCSVYFLIFWRSFLHLSAPAGGSQSHLPNFAVCANQFDFPPPKKIKISKVIKLQLRHVIESTDMWQGWGGLVLRSPVTSELKDSFFLLLLACSTVWNVVVNQQASSYFLKFPPLSASIIPFLCQAPPPSGFHTGSLLICPSIHPSIRLLMTTLEKMTKHIYVWFYS